VVAEVRKALGDTRGSARYLRTVHGYGYAFSGDVVADEELGPKGQTPARHGLVWQSKEVPLREGESLIGRGADCDVRIDAPDVSRHHARIRIEGDAATLEDLGSRNGTYLGGRRVRGVVPLSHGAEILLGPEILLFRVSGATRSTRTGRHRESRPL
jgi:hypothetical protein